jgi:hypothetical protein
MLTHAGSNSEGFGLGGQAKGDPMTTTEKSLFSLPVFRYTPSGDKLVDGREREELQDSQSRTRWDYFFRTTPTDIENYFSESYSQALSNQRQASEDVKKILVPFGILLALGLIALFFGTYGVIAGIVVIGVTLWQLFPRLTEVYKRLREAESEIERIKSLIADLTSQIPKNFPSDQEMRQFINDRLGALETRAKSHLRLDSGEITVDKHIPPIYEWALLQSETKPGYKSLPEKNREALTVAHDGKPVYAVYYVQYLFPTRDYIAVHGEFYDIIRDETRGRLTDEYYYADVTSVRTEMAERKPFFSTQKLLEATHFRLTVSSGDAVEVTFLDEHLQQTLNDYLENQRKARVEDLERLRRRLENASDDEKASIQREIEKVREARERIQQEDKSSLANNVVRDIRHQLRLKKGASEV